MDYSDTASPTASARDFETVPHEYMDYVECVITPPMQGKVNDRYT